MRHTPYLLALTLILLFAAPAHAYTLGAADGTIEAAPIAAQMGARTYRIVMDPSVPLEHYAPRIDAYRAQGMRPQLVIGGTGTDVRGKTDAQGYRMINYALKAYERWPDTYSVSIHNEPALSGASACQYNRNFRRAYKALKKAGVPRVLFGEYNPHGVLEQTGKAIGCAKRDIVADGWAWHCYDVGHDWEGIQHAQRIHRYLKKVRRDLHTPRGFTLPLFCTEYGVMTRGANAYGEDAAAKSWARALQVAKQQKLVQIVAWQIDEAHEDSKWDTSLRRSDGSFRPAFDTIAHRN